ncbi:hypothetical protein SAMN05428973_115124 [Duganella sp. OV510]|jgi:F0F1-type ATP synthase assembly protein I|nr:hypothetical protein SAMN05428973_115124 [Duganella sp. OV510]
MKPLDIYLFLILGLHLTTCAGALIYMRRYMKKKYPDKKTAGEDRPSV